MLPKYLDTHTVPRGHASLRRIRTRPHSPRPVGLDVPPGWYSSGSTAAPAVFLCWLAGTGQAGGRLGHATQHGIVASWCLPPGYQLRSLPGPIYGWCLRSGDNTPEPLRVMINWHGGKHRTLTQHSNRRPGVQASAGRAPFFNPEPAPRQPQQQHHHHRRQLQPQQHTHPVGRQRPGPAHGMASAKPALLGESRAPKSKDDLNEFAFDESDAAAAMSRVGRNAKERRRRQAPPQAEQRQSRLVPAAQHRRGRTSAVGQQSSGSIAPMSFEAGDHTIQYCWKRVLRPHRLTE